jgi:hypothetical protein
MDPLAHASVALMARPLAPRAPLWALVAAAQVPDALFFAFEAAGMERKAKTRFDPRHGLIYETQPRLPWSHGLLMNAVWAAAVAGLAQAVTRDRRTSAVMGLLSFSHWLVDATVYNKLPLAFDDAPATGLGLITSGAGFVLGCVLEAALIGGGIWAAVRRRNKTAARAD